MSDRLPIISGREVVKVLQKVGYKVVRQRGSHIRLRDESNQNHKPLTVPDKRTIKPGLLRRLIRDAGMTVAEFVKLLRK